MQAMKPGLKQKGNEYSPTAIKGQPCVHRHMYIYAQKRELRRQNYAS